MAARLRKRGTCGRPAPRSAVAVSQVRPVAGAGLAVTMTAVTVTSQNMPAAFIPSPARGLWHIGPIPVRGYALCVVLGIIVCLWVADRRYLKIGGAPGFHPGPGHAGGPAGAGRGPGLRRDHQLSPLLRPGS